MPAPSLDHIITEIEQWFSDTMHNSVVSREIAVYNHVHTAYEDLKVRMATLVTGKPVKASPSEPASEPAAEAPAVAEPLAKSTPAA